MKKSNVLVFLLFMLVLLIFSSVDNAQSDQIDNLIKNLDSNYRDLRMSAIWTLGKVNDPRALDALISALKHEDLGVRIAAADALGDKKDPEAIDPLIAGLKENEETVSEAFVKALANITGKDFGQDHDQWEKWWNQNRKTVLKNN
jgi:HEAT repeat protein